MQTEGNSRNFGRELEGLDSLDSIGESTSGAPSSLSDVSFLEAELLKAPSSDNFLGDLRSSQLRRSKSSLRMKYEAEALFIKKKLGGLEEIRIQLGLSQRKVCQLLLVDPSAWTRWTRDQESAPPHIYRMLSWYLALHDKYPALDVNFWLSTVARVENTEAPRNEEFSRKLADMNSQMKQREAGLLESMQLLSAQVTDLRDQLEKERAKKSRKKNPHLPAKKTAGFWARLLKRSE